MLLDLVCSTLSRSKPLLWIDLQELENDICRGIADEVGDVETTRERPPASSERRNDTAKGQMGGSIQVHRDEA